MGFLDTLLGRSPAPQQPPSLNGGYSQPFGQGAPGASPAQLRDEQAVARYRYMLQTAPPETLEQAHQEAFARLSPDQRRLALQQISSVTPPEEQSHLSDDPRSMAQAATRAEMRQPGSMERAFGQPNQAQGSSQGGPQGGMGGGMMGGMGGMGGMMMGSLMASVAGGFIGSAIANSFFSSPGVAQDYAQSDAAQAAGDTNPSLVSDTGAAENPSPDPYGDPANSGGFGDLGGDEI